VWTFGFALGLTLVGRLSDIFGRRWFYISSTALCLIGNIMACSAQSISQLIAANVIIGLSAAGQLSFNVVLGELVPNSARGPFNALVLFTSAPFSVFAGPVARAFMDQTTQKWRWCYYIGIIINAVALILWYLFYYPPPYEMLHVRGKSKWRMVMDLDWLGICLLSAGLILFLIGLNWGGSTYPWKSAHVLATLLVGFATMAGFCVWEVFCGLEYPLIPMRLFLNIQYVAIVACASVGAMIYYSMLVLWPTLCQTLFTTSSEEVGWLSVSLDPRVGNSSMH
jgi:MFS family permease